MSIDLLQAHYGFTRTPFGRDLAPGMLHRSAGHGEAVARISWCIAEKALGVITGEVGSGKTVAARAATTALDASRHTVIYLGNPAVGARGIYAAIVTALGGVPRFHKAALIPQAADALAAEEAEKGKRVVVVVDEAHLLSADQLEELRLLTNADMDSHARVRVPPHRSTHPPAADQARHLRRPRPADPAPLRNAVDERRRDRRLHRAPPHARRPQRHHVQRRRHQPSSTKSPEAYPRAVNNLAVQALVAAYATNKSIVDEASARAAVTEITAD